MQMEISQRELSFKIDWFLPLYTARWKDDGTVEEKIWFHRGSKGDSGHCAAQQIRLVHRICNDP